MQINRCKIEYKQKKGEKNQIITSIDAEKGLDKIQHPSMIKALKQLRIEGMYLNIIRAIYDKLIADIILNWKKN
jgi:hypothetical protein